MGKRVIILSNLYDYLSPHLILKTIFFALNKRGDVFSQTERKKRYVVALIMVFLVFILVPIESHGGDIILTWDQNTEEELAGYKIYYGTSSRSYFDNPTELPKEMGVVIDGRVTYPFPTELTPGVTYYFTVTAYDASGYETDFSNEVQFTPPGGGADITPPSGSIIINGGDAVTYSLDNILALSASDDGQELDTNAVMTFSNDGQEWSLPEPYATLKIWTLAPGGGEKKVYVKFRDGAGNWMTEPSEDQIMYEESQTISRPPIGTVIINNHDYITDAPTVFLTLFAIDEGRELDAGGLMTFSNDGQQWSEPEAYATGKLWTLSPGNGVKTVYGNFRDDEGIWMVRPAQDQIYYEASEMGCDDPHHLRPVSISSSHRASLFSSAEDAVDGNPLTAWSAFSFAGKDQFITLDLGEIKNFSSLTMYASKMFGTDFFPRDFQIQISRDNNTWASIKNEQGYVPPLQPPYKDTWDFDELSCRYLRISITRAPMLFALFRVVQIAEIEVYGCDLEEAPPSMAEAASAGEPGEKGREKSRAGSLKAKSSITPSTPGRPHVSFE